MYNSLDLFSGVGGLSAGLKKAGFKVNASIEINEVAVKGYKLNNRYTKVFQQDIRTIDTEEIKSLLKGQPLHLLAGCPPCQGFSTIRKLNRKQSVRDDRNSLVLEYLRFAKELMPLTLMMENVPGLEDYYHFKYVVNELRKLGYKVEHHVVNVKDYGVPQSRKRLVLVGSLLGEIKIVEGTGKKKTVRQTIGKLEKPEDTIDPAHKIVAKHREDILDNIKLVPHNGGSKKDVPGWNLVCHDKPNVGFNDVYGRLRWDDYSTTITGGCLNPSKGRFLHPEQDRALTLREAALLQTFPKNYKFPVDAPKTALALLIGNALPPKFSEIQSRNIKEHIDKYLG